MENKFYLAYGSNLNVQQMEFRCPDAIPVGYTYLEDYRLVFRGSKTGSYLTVEPCVGSSVPCGVWSISDEDESSLDLYEGFPRFYRKETMNVDIVSAFDGRVINADAMIYIMTDGRPISPPSWGYVQVCFAGCDDFGFDRQAIKNALFESSRTGVRK